MKTIILPGFSPKNKDWAYLVANTLKKSQPTVVHEWKHWKSGKTKKKWMEEEVKLILKEINNKKFNLLTKSIGTMVAMSVLKLTPKSINKIILCGIPVQVFKSGDNNSFEELKQIPPERLLCIQNKNDPLGSLTQVKKLLNPINRFIKIHSKPRSDHEYPYVKAFVKFLN